MLKIMRHTHPDLQFMHLLPYGAVLHDHGTQFVVFSRNATAMRLLLYNDPDDREPAEVLSFDPRTDRWGDIWSIFVPELGPGTLYHFQADGPFVPNTGMRFQAQNRLIDPYARALTGTFQPSNDGIIRPPKCVVVDDYFDWEGDRHLNHDLSETVIYELHVKGFTQHESSKVQDPGTYRGLTEKIPYLQSLGVTAVELMPIHEFPIMDFDGSEPDRRNYWGYDPMAFFAPHRGYAADQSPGGQVNEFKQMVKEFHRAGIEVILDVVFNHTCEGNHLGPNLSFKGLENSVYYMLEEDPRRFRNYSGCGNTVNGNHPIVREMIFHCLRHWVHNYHIDGFRFDLASILSRDQQGNLVANPPLVDAIAEDPLLSDTKIIAEAWDAAGAYQVGTFGSSDRWAEWNGRFRDDSRKYWRGEHGMRGAMATRLSGSADLYQSGGRPPYCSINFITSHDGFTLNDLVSYNHKHNQANNEDNRDGDNHNISYNFGHEGPTDDPQIESVRLRQIKNMLATLLLSQGTPMLVAGDECRRTQQGNNNAYCQDNQISWFDWSLVEENTDLLRFARTLIHFRRGQPTVRRRRFMTGEQVQDRLIADVTWFDETGQSVDWHHFGLAMGCLLAAPRNADQQSDGGLDLFFLFNPNEHVTNFSLASIVTRKNWRRFIDTGAESPDDIYLPGDGPVFQESKVKMLAKSTMVFVSEN